MKLRLIDVLPRIQLGKWGVMLSIVVGLYCYYVQDGDLPRLECEVVKKGCLDVISLTSNTFGLCDDVIFDYSGNRVFPANGASHLFLESRQPTHPYKHDLILHHVDDQVVLPLAKYISNTTMHHRPHEWLSNHMILDRGYFTDTLQLDDKEWTLHHFSFNPVTRQVAVQYQDTIVIEHMDKKESFQLKGQADFMSYYDDTLYLVYKNTIRIVTFDQNTYKPMSIKEDSLYRIDYGRPSNPNMGLLHQGNMIACAK